MKKVFIFIILILIPIILGASKFPPSPPSSSGGISIVKDTSPELGGGLDTNGQTISDSSGGISLDDNVSISGSLSINGGTDTYICFYDDNVLVCNQAAFTVNKTTGVMTVTGGFNVPGTAYGGQIAYYREDTDNGANYVGIAAPASVTNDLMLLLPATADPTSINRKLIAAVPSSVTGSDNVARDSSQLSFADDTESIGVACSDESTDLTTGTAKVTFRMPFAMTVTEVRANVNTAPVGSTIIVDINEGGTTILSTKLTIDASEETSTTAATPAVVSDSALADDAEITVDIDQIGSSTAGTGLKIWIIGLKS